MENDVEYKTIENSHYSGLKGSEQNFVILNEDSWKQFWDQYRSDCTPNPKLPAVDFSKQMVLVAYMGVKNTGGYDVTIKKITKQPDLLEVIVKKTSPQGGLRTEALTQPAHIVLTERYEGKISFVDSQ